MDCPNGNPALEVVTDTSAHKRCGMAWDRFEDEALLTRFGMGEGARHIAQHHERTVQEILDRLVHAGYLVQDDQTAGQYRRVGTVYYDTVTTEE